MTDTTSPYPVTVTVGAVSYHGSYTVEANVLRVTCGQHVAELTIAMGNPQCAAEGLLRAIAKRIALERR
jgi:hypothetical protein